MNETFFNETLILAQLLKTFQLTERFLEADSALKSQNHQPSEYNIQFLVYVL